MKINSEMQNSNLIIRSEKEEDHKKTEHMVMRAFLNIHGPGCNEHLLVRKIRNSSDYLPEISRVIELDGEIVGAIYYTKAKVINGEESYEVITFGPLAVEPTLQNTGIGRLLLDETIKLARETGVAGICIYGEPTYYPKRGFRTCDQFGITDPEGNNYDAFMAYPLDEKKFSRIQGKFILSSVFKECENEEELVAMNSEFPDYPKIKIQEGFMLLNEGRIGRIKSMNETGYIIGFWELELPAQLDDSVFKGAEALPQVGDVVIFEWATNGVSTITALRKNLY